MSNAKLVRHGDIYLMRVEELPENLKEIPRVGGQVVLAHGTATGHSHRFNDVANVVDFFEDEDKKRYLHIKADSILEHDEHGPIEFKADTKWEVRRQVQFTSGHVSVVAD